MHRKIVGIALAASLVLSFGAWAQAKDTKGKEAGKTSPKLEELIQKGEYQKAVDLANKFIAAKEVTEGLYIDLGVAYFNLKDYPKAIEAYEKAVELNPFGTQALLYEATTYHAMGQDDKVLDVLKRVLQVDPTNKEVLYDYGQMLEKAGKPDDALAQYDQVYALDPGFKDVAFTLGVIHYNNGQYDKAEPYFAKALELKPNDEQVLLGQSQNFIKGGKLDKAVVPLKTYLDTAKNETYKPTLTGTLAGIYMKLKQYPEAVAAFDKLLAMRPNSESALEGKANALIQMDKASEAVPVLEQFLAVSQNDAEKKKVQELLKEIKTSKKR